MKPYRLQDSNSDFSIAAARTNNSLSCNIKLCPPFKREVWESVSLEDNPRDITRVHKVLGEKTTISDLSRLHLNDEHVGSESVVSFDSVSTKSETVYLPRHGAVLSECLVQSPTSTVSRRGSCPSVVSGNSAVLKPSETCPVRRVLSMSHIPASVKSANMGNRSHLSTDERRERLKTSLSRLSQSVVSLAKSMSKSNESHRVYSNAENAPEGPTEHESMVKSNSLPLPAVEKSEISDLLSPLSPISKANESHLSVAPFCETTGTDKPVHRESPQIFGTLRIHPGSGVHTARPPLGPSSTTLEFRQGQASTMKQPFVPSELGKTLLGIYSTNGSQEAMWATFIDTCKSPIDFADTASRMPSIVFCLRGLIRFGHGECGIGRSDVIMQLFQILLRRHPICDTNSFLEAVECSAAIVSMLCINPITRQPDFPRLEPRSKFESVLTAQNGFLFQQVVTVLSVHLPKYVAVESQKDPTIPFMTRAISSLLEVVYVYTSNATLRSCWLDVAPTPFKHSLVLSLAALAQRFPVMMTRCLAILDAILDFIQLDLAMCRQIAQYIHVGITRSPSPMLESESTQIINKWGGIHQGSRRRSGSFGSFFRSISGKMKNSSTSTKSTVYTEYSNLC
jgi:hypothetical protein